MSRRVRLPLGRIVAAALLLLALVVLTVQVATRLAGLEEAAAEGRDEPELAVAARERVRVRVVVDGEERFSGVLAPGARLEFPAGHRAEVELGDLDRAQVTYDGRLVAPLGVVDGPRRLVFLDD